MNITVYLGANEGSDPALAAAVRELGSWIGANGRCGRNHCELRDRHGNHADQFLC